jgi:hypothetical protein
MKAKKTQLSKIKPKRIHKINQITSKPPDYEFQSNPDTLAPGMVSADSTKSSAQYRPE